MDIVFAHRLVAKEKSWTTTDTSQTWRNHSYGGDCPSVQLPHWQYVPCSQNLCETAWLILWWKEGLTFYWGTSEWSAMQIQQATEIARRLNMVGPVAEQPHYSMLHRERFEAEYEPLWRYENYGRLVCSKDWDGTPNLLLSSVLSGLLSTLVCSPVNTTMVFLKTLDTITISGVRWTSVSRNSSLPRARPRLKRSRSSLRSPRGLVGQWPTLLWLGLWSTRGCPLVLWVIYDMDQDYSVKNSDIRTTARCHQGMMIIMPAKPREVRIWANIRLPGTQPEQIKENVKALDIYPKLTPEVMEEIEKIIDNKPDSPVSIYLKSKQLYICLTIVKHSPHTVDLRPTDSLCKGETPRRIKPHTSKRDTVKGIGNCRKSEGGSQSGL